MDSLDVYARSSTPEPPTVYIWQFCAPMIQRRSEALGTRATGIALLVVFNLLWLITVASWVTAVVTQPGFAKDFVPRVDHPPLPPPGAGGEQGYAAHTQGAQYGQHVTLQEHAIPEQPLDESIPLENSALSPQPAARSVAPVPQAPAHTEADAHPARQPSAEEPETSEALPALLGPTIAGAIEGAMEGSRTQGSIEEQQQAQLSQGAQPHMPAQLQHPPPQLSLLPEPQRQPPSPAPLHPSQRWCATCQLVKPMRAHHCRKCNACVLKMDHHCPWVGGCVGARNHKVFCTFLLWTTVFEVWTLVSLAVGYASRSQTNGYIISVFAM